MTAEFDEDAAIPLILVMHENHFRVASEGNLDRGETKVYTVPLHQAAKVVKEHISGEKEGVPAKWYETITKGLPEEAKYVLTSGQIFKRDG